MRAASERFTFTSSMHTVFLTGKLTLTLTSGAALRRHDSSFSNRVSFNQPTLRPQSPRLLSYMSIYDPPHDGGRRCMSAPPPPPTHSPLDVSPCFAAHSHRTRRRSSGPLHRAPTFTSAWQRALRRPSTGRKTSRRRLPACCSEAQRKCSSHRSGV